MHERARLRIERAEWLVHQKDIGIEGKRTGDRGALLHAAGQLRWVAVFEAAQSHEIDKRLRPAFALGARHALPFESVEDVGADRLPRKQRKMLEYNAAIGTGRRDRLPFHDDAAGFGRQKSADQIKQRGFAAAGGAEQGHKFARAHVKRNVGQRQHRSAARRPIGMVHPFDDDLALAVHACRLRCCGAYPLPAGGTLTGAVQETKHCETEASPQFAVRRERLLRFAKSSYMSVKDKPRKPEAWNAPSAKKSRRCGSAPARHSAAKGILAVTKALLQSGVSYVGGYQGAPVSHLLDVMVDAKDLLDELGVHVETCTNEAAAAAMLGASINYPLRGAVTWKSIVGTNVAADALSNLASPGVIGGALIVLGEDYGEGASVIQERSYAYAMKSSIWLLDPRPDLPTIVHMVEKGFELSEASHAPVMIDLRVRACHVTGEFAAKDNKRGLYNAHRPLAGPPRFEYGRLAHPPVTFTQERLKIEQRLPAAQKFIREQKLNELIAGETKEIGVVVLGGLTNGLLRALERLDLADLYGVSRIPIYVLNVAYPLVPEEVREFCAGKRAVLVVEEGAPDYVEQQINVILRDAGADTRVYGKGSLPASGDYTSDVTAARHRRFSCRDAAGRNRRGLKFRVASNTCSRIALA